MEAQAKLDKAREALQNANDKRLARFLNEAQAAFYKEIRLGKAALPGQPTTFAESVYLMTKAEIAARAAYVAAGESAQDGQPYWPRVI